MGKAKRAHRRVAPPSRGHGAFRAFAHPTGREQMTRMTFDERLKAICGGMEARGLDLILATHDGAHFIETPNPVTVLCGFKSLRPAICLMDRAGATTLIVAPAWDAERARTPRPTGPVV